MPSADQPLPIGLQAYTNRADNHGNFSRTEYFPWHIFTVYPLEDVVANISR